MSEAAKIDENRRESIKILKFVIAGLVAINIISIYGLIRSFETRQIWVSPDLSSGQMVINSGPYRSYVY
ncbi:DUF2895 family protein, partial [Vibrio parahaemolyticus]